MLSEQIKQEITKAMRAGDTLRRDVLRVALGELQLEEGRQGRPLPDDEAQRIVRKLIKSNQETMEASGPGERADRLRAEIEALESLLPQALSVEQIVAALEPVADQVRAAGNDGQATGVAMKHLKSSGAAVEGRDVAEAVKRMRS